MQEPVVSICCLVYNHEPFLRECFEGFVMQKTTFPIEILVHDDASTDHSADIIREYTAKYPDLFKPIYQTENQYSKGVKVSATFQFPRAKGKYIALCEGDDYWTDPYKLQKQVDFLESHPEYVMCSHGYRLYNQLAKKYEKGIKTSPHTYSLSSFVAGQWSFHTLTVLFRRESIHPNFYLYKKSIDAILFYSILKNGKGFYMADDGAVYRIHSGGAWSGASLSKRKKTEFEVKLAICEIEQSKEACCYLMTQFKKSLSRVWILKHMGLMSRVFVALSRHYGYLATFRIFMRKMIYGAL